MMNSFRIESKLAGLFQSQTLQHLMIYDSEMCIIVHTIRLICASTMRPIFSSILRYRFRLEELRTLQVMPKGSSNISSGKET